MPPVSVIENHMASLLAVENEADLLECFRCLAARDNWKRGHLRGDADFYDIGRGDRELLRFADFDDSLNRFLNVLQGFFSRGSLRNTSGKRRALGHDITIFTSSKRNKVFVRHWPSLLQNSVYHK